MMQVRVLLRQAEVTALRLLEAVLEISAYWASGPFILYRHERKIQYLNDLHGVMGWSEWPLDFSECSSWPTLYRIAPMHLEQAHFRGDLFFSFREDHWGREELQLPEPTPRRVEADLLQWLAKVGVATPARPDALS
ncbi:ANKRD17, partial [Symbiodinium sp. KB8]